MEFIRRNTNILFVFILPVYLYIVQNSIQNKHTHVYANGIVITHSHPFDKECKTANNEHEHSEREICLYSSLHFDFYETEFLTELEVKYKEFRKSYLIENERISPFSPALNLIPRGPPV